MSVHETPAMSADREALVAEVAGMLAGSHFVIHDHTPPAIGEHIHLSPQAAAHLANALADLLAARDRRVRAEALRRAAERLPALTEGPDRAATETWPSSDRGIYSLAIEEAQSALRARADRIEDDA